MGTCNFYFGNSLCNIIYYFGFYKTLLDKSIALSISGGLLLVAYLVLKYGFKGVEDNE